MLFSLPGAAPFGAALRAHLPCEEGTLEVHVFPDGESCPRFVQPVAGRDVVLVASLSPPDARLVRLYLAACVALELGATSVGLVLPYLPYMRQDARFRDGEGVTSSHIARLLCHCCDWIVTVDPHLHRHHALSDIYRCETRAARAAPAIAHWVNQHVPHPVIVGPDSESRQWVAEVANMTGCPWTVMDKTRHGDHEVEIAPPDAQGWEGRTPVLVDDIVSTAQTMIAAVRQLLAAGTRAPVCVAVHALFAGEAHAQLQGAGAARIVSCNTVAHDSNDIDVSAAVAACVAGLLAGR